MTRVLVDERARLLDERRRLLLELATIERAICECEAEEHTMADYRWRLTERGIVRSW